MITIIFGQPRAGKTALMSMLAGERMTKYARGDLMDCKRLITVMNASGFNLTLPPKHLVFADYYIEGRKYGLPPRFCHRVDGFYLGLPNKRHPTMFLPPYAQIYLDEAQGKYNSRNSRDFPDFVSRFYELHGHNRMNITLACQRPKLIDLNIREIAGRFIEVQGMKNKYDRSGRLTASVWYCREFESIFEVEAYQNQNRPDNIGSAVKYRYKGDIFRCYDSHNFFALHYRDRYAEDFDIEPSTRSGVTLADVIAFNETQSYEVPETFYKEKR